jgi:hypothetical protein
MGAAMGFAHDSNNCDTTGSPHRLCLQERGQLVLVVVWQCADDFHQFGCLRDSVFLSYIMDERIQDDLLSLLVALNQLSDDFRDILQEKHILVDFALALFVRLR